MKHHKKSIIVLLGVVVVSLLVVFLCGWQIYKVDNEAEKVKKEQVVAKAMNEEDTDSIDSYETLWKILKQSHLLYTKAEYSLNEAFTRVQYSDGVCYESTSTAEPMENKEMGISDSITGGDSSTTNTQVQGVDEGDVVKVDGKYIYVLTYNEVKVLQAHGKELIKIGSIAGGRKYYEDMYLKNHQLILIGQKYSDQDIVYKESIFGRDYPSYERQAQTQVAFYDVSNPLEPKLQNQLSIKGYLLTTRFANDKLYTVTRQNIPVLVKGTFKEEQVLPGYTKDTGENVIIPLNQIIYCKDKLVESFTILTEIHVPSQEVKDMEAFLGSTGELYMNEQNIYLAEAEYRMEEATNLYKYTISQKGIEWVNKGSVKGRILNQFSMDEYKGNLRIATTSSEGNHIYILDQELKEIGTVKNLAPGERIYAVRFMGSMGYVVTFVQVDPLFVLDLSDATHPQVVGELKIPGFSNYLHPVGKGLLLGIGRSTVEVIERSSDGVETVVGAREDGLKISLFDVTQPANPKEVNSYPIDGRNSYSEANYSHKAFLYDAKYESIFVPAYIQDDHTNNYCLLIYKVKNGKLVKEPIMKLNGSNSEEWYYGENQRVIYIDNYVYALNIQGERVKVDLINRESLEYVAEYVF